MSQSSPNAGNDVAPPELRRVLGPGSLVTLGIGSIIGTSGFFRVAGLVVALVAWLVIVLERRLSRTETKAEV